MAVPVRNGVLSDLINFRQEKSMEYVIKRSERKTMGLYALPDGGFEVRAPYFVNEREVEQFVEKNLDWVNKQKCRQEEKESHLLTYGSMIPFIGREFPLIPGGDNGYGFSGESFYAPPGLKNDELIKMMSRLLKVLAEQYVLPLAAQLACDTGKGAAHFGITSAKTRWGSCNTNGNINFSWRLVCASDDCIRYVIVHELCHLAQPNHSKAFWLAVGKQIPDWKKYRGQLKTTQRKLDNIGLF